MIKKLFPTLITGLIFLSACSTNRMAEQKVQIDDVYYTEAQAKEESKYYATEKVEPSKNYVTDEELYGDNTGDNNENDYDQGFYDGSYSARINRFRNYSPWRNYYDDWYGFDPFFNNFNTFNNFNNFNNFFSPGIHLGFGQGFGNMSFNNFNNNNFFNNNFHNPWNFYGSQYFGNYWGPVSYFNMFNPYGNRFFGNSGGGFFGNAGLPAYTNPNYRSRPNRETENIRTGAIPENTGRIGTAPSRPERILNSPTNQGSADRPDRSSQPASSRPSRSNDGQPREVTPEKSGSSRPATRPTEARPSRPQRENAPPPRMENSPSERQSSSPSSPAPSRSSGENNGSRPTRGGN